MVKVELVKQPKEVSYFTENSLNVVQVSCSKGEKHNHTMCVCSNGQAFAWGDQYKGQLGTLPVGTDWSHEIKKMQSQPAPIVGLPEGTQVRKVMCGGIHSALLTMDGLLYTWGCGSDGRLGHPEYEGYVYLYKESRPKLVRSLLGTPVVDVESAYYHTMCLV